MPKQTLEAALRARGNDPRALRGAILLTQGKPRIVFGVVGEHRRFSVEVHGDELKLVDDPRADDAEEAAEQAEDGPATDLAPAPAVEPATEPEGGAEQAEDGDGGEGADKPAGKRSRGKK
jgi:hypothetical protein